MALKKPVKKELIEWGLILMVGIILYTTGTLGEVVGHAQEALLWTGILQPNIHEKSTPSANYDVPLISLDGERTTLDAFRGKVIFLNFWATWCPPCIAEMPFINKLYNQVGHNKNIVFVMISEDDNMQKARTFIKNKGFKFPVYMLAGPLPQEFRSDEIPTTFIISPQGKIVVHHKGMSNYDTSSFKTFLTKLAESASVSTP